MVVVVAAFGRADVDDEDEAEAVVVVVVLKMIKDSILMKNDVMRTRWQLKLIVPIVHTFCIMRGRPVVCRLASKLSTYDTREDFSSPSTMTIDELSHTSIYMH